MLRINRLRIFLTGISILMLSACMPSIAKMPKSQPTQKPTPVTTTATKTENHCIALNYYEALSTMSEAELMQEEKMLRENVKTIQNSCDQLHLAILMSMPSAGIKNEEESELIFIKILKQEQFLSVRERQITQLLLEQLQQRIKMQAEQQLLKKQLKEERSASLKLLEKLADKESKLKQLKNIEKNINKQEQEISAPSTYKIPHDTK